jgi:hypothetical protein
MLNLAITALATDVDILCIIDGARGCPIKSCDHAKCCLR